MIGAVRRIWGMMYRHLALYRRSWPRLLELADGAMPWGHLAWACGLNVAWLVAASLLFARQFRVARERGALLSIGE